MALLGFFQDYVAAGEFNQVSLFPPNPFSQSFTTFPSSSPNGK
jgi:hypothetical protein